MEWVAQELDEWADAHLLNVLIILGAAWGIRKLSTQIINQLLKRIVRPSVYPTKSDRQKRIKTLRG
ncbi:MAG: hypothetical protein ACRD4B_09735, partial [Acidobacteriota bacterium]